MEHKDNIGQMTEPKPKPEPKPEHFSKASVVVVTGVVMVWSVLGWFFGGLLRQWRAPGPQAILLWCCLCCGG